MVPVAMVMTCEFSAVVLEIAPTVMLPVMPSLFKPMVVLSNVSELTVEAILTLTSGESMREAIKPSDTVSPSRLALYTGWKLQLLTEPGSTAVPLPWSAC